MNHLILTHDVLNITQITDIVSAHNCGAISLFIGTTHDSFAGKKLISLEYEANEPMAIKQMEAICEELRKKWPDISNIAIYHRLGHVSVGQSSMVIAIASPHYKTSLDAVASAVEELKKHEPITKKEKYEDNNEVHNKKSLKFDEKVCIVDDTNEPSNQLVQISVAEDEIERRVNCFKERKRNENDFYNIMDYTREKNDESHDLETCARVNSSIIKQECSAGHLKVKRVKNNVGPQMRPDYLNTLDKLMTSKMANDNRKFQIQPSDTLNQSTVIDRLENIEQYLHISPLNMNNIYKRLKYIEDRIVYLEGVSPEYKNFLQEMYNGGNQHCNYETVKSEPGGETFTSSFKRKIYNTSDIDSFIESIENSN